MSSPLSPDQWQQLESLVDALLDTPPERRSALFAEVSGGDPARRAELERLVAECERAYPLLDQPAANRFAALVDVPPLQPAQEIAGRYRVVRELGRGGMATVYLAHDLKHARDVALKVVRSELVATVGSGRFLREIEIAAQLRHPNIVPLYDSGEVTGLEGQMTPLLYYVMPYESGQSLRERLRRDGPLPIDDAVVILRDVCEALAYAHGRGIVHRDIKPDNILLSGRHALVTDFGVARAATEATVPTISSGPGVVIGTPAYMAPEQVGADPRLDHRVDLYGVGVLAYEILTGIQPLGGDSPQDILAAQLTKRPDPVSRHRPDVPAALAELVMKCLEKQAAERWQSAAEILRALDASLVPSAVPPRPRRRWIIAAVVAAVIVGATALARPLLERRSAARPTTSEHRLTVGILPVGIASPRRDLDWLADGLERQLSAQLGQVQTLDVRPKETIVDWMRSGMAIDSVALERKVDYFVKAGVSRGDADSLVITLELIEHGIRSVRAGVVRLPSNVGATVDVVGRRLAERLRPMLGSRAREQDLATGSTNERALALRRQADHHRLIARERLFKFDHQGAARALDSANAFLLEGERLDRNWSALRLARASVSAARGYNRFVESRGQDLAGVRRGYDAGIAILDSVIQRKPRDASALALRGRLRWQLVNFTGLTRSTLGDSAKEDLARALSIDTTHARAAADLSQIYHLEGDYEQAATFAERADRLDAYMEESDQVIDRLALSYLELGRDADAARACAEGLRRFPENPAHTACTLDVMAWGSARPDPDSAWLYYRQLERLSDSTRVGTRAFYTAAVAAVLAKSRTVRPDSVRAVLDRLRRDVETRAGSPPSLKDDLLAYEAAVAYRLGRSARADSLLAEFRRRQPHSLLVRRRMLRAYAPAASAPNAR